jgi:hypothetical protein
MPRFAVADAAVALLSMPVVSPARAVSVTDFIVKWDPDHDGTLDMPEINKAADALFDKLDVDRDGTLDESEYESIVARRFHAANRDNDTTIEANELRTPAGKELLKLLE